MDDGRPVLRGPRALARGPADCQKKRSATDASFYRGICYTSHVAGSRSSRSIVDWVMAQRINLVVIDFFAIAYNHDYTPYRKIQSLMKRLSKEGVTVLADYRPSTSEPGKSWREEAPDLCLSDPKVRGNIIGWGLLLLERCPAIDILTLYNPLPSFERNRDCKACRKKGDEALLEDFFAEWSEAIRKAHPKVKLGATLPASANTYRALARSLDVFTPFVSLIAEPGRNECGPGVMKRVAEAMRPVRKLRPVLPLVKLYWKQATRNSTADVVHAMDEAAEARLAGFFLWYRSLLTNELAKRVEFELPEYDFEAICDTYRELAGMRPQKKKRKKKRNKKTSRASGRG